MARTRFRFWRAHWTALVVILSYSRLSLLSRIRGRDYVDSIIAEVHRRNAKRIEQSILKLKGLFIKVGQLISIMTNFLPEEFRKPLESLQDQIPPRPSGEIQAQIEQELGKPLKELFASFDPPPLASASLGQVHRATLASGEEVVVKVQHADIDTMVRQDLHIIRRIMQLITRLVGIQGLDLVYRQVREMVLAELDFVREAASMQQIGENLRAVDNVHVPTVVDQFSSRRILTMHYCQGTTPRPSTWLV